MQNILTNINYTNKNNRQITAIISLFGHCNLHCKFCNQRHNNKYPSEISMYTIQNCVALLWKKLHKQFFQEQYTKINFLIQGGQVLSDFVTDDLINFPNIFKSKLSLYFKNIDYSIKFVSNGIFLNRQLVLNMLNELNAKIIFSYDPIDRFIIKAQKNTFLSTLEFFYQENRIDSLNILLNKKTIKKYIENDSEIKQICKKYNTIVNLIYYIPNENENIYGLTDTDIYNFYKFALKSDWKKFCPEINNLEKAINNIKQNIKLSIRHCNCQHIYRLTPESDSYTNNCISCNYNLENYNLENYSQNQGKNVIINGLLKNKCNQCEYVHNCIMPCWNTILNKNYTFKKCPFKKLIREMINV